MGGDIIIRKIGFYVFATMMILVILNVFESVQLDFFEIKNETMNRVSKSWDLPQIKMSFIAMIFGIVVECEV